MGVRLKETHKKCPKTLKSNRNQSTCLKSIVSAAGSSSSSVMSSSFLFRKKSILLSVAYRIIVAVCKLNNRFSKESPVLSTAKQKKSRKEGNVIGRESGD
jgi:hypothetical protein